MDKDIKTAIEQENIFFEKSKIDNTTNIYDYIGIGGYDNVDEYIADKNEYLFHNLDYEIKQPLLENKGMYENVFSEYFKNEKPSFLWLIDDGKTYAFVPTTFTKFDLLERRDIIPLRMGYYSRNGLIITSSGDLRIVIVIPKDIEFYDTNVLIAIKDILSEYFQNVEVDHNDIMLDGKKVAGSVECTNGKMRSLMFQISFVNNVKLIKSICTESVKEPGFIDNSVITPYELKERILEWLLKR